MGGGIKRKIESLRRAEKRAAADEIFLGRTWRDMPCGDEFSQRMNFALFKRGLYDPMDELHIEDAVERKRSKLFRRSLVLSRARCGQRASAHINAEAARGPCSPEDIATRPDTEDDMWDVKQRSRAVCGFQPLPGSPPRVIDRRLRSARGSEPPRKCGPPPLGHTTLDERIALRARIIALMEKHHVTRSDILRAAGIGICGGNAWLTPSGMPNDDKRWPMVRAALTRMENGDVKIARAWNNSGNFLRKRKEAAS